MKLSRHFAIALLPLLLASARADDKPDLQTILDAWKAREKATKSFDFRWRSERYEDPAIHDGQSASYVAKYRFLMDDRDRARLEHDDEEWSPEKASYVPRTTVRIFDGIDDRALLKGGAQGFPRLQLNGNHGASTIGYTFWTFPVMMMFRSLKPLTGSSAVFDENKVELSQTSPTSDGFVVLRFSAAAIATTEVSVDPTKDFVPVRLVENYQGVTICRMTIAHRHDPVDGWLPQSWTIEVFVPGSGKLRASESATVVQHSINKSIADAEFQLDLSGGAYVNDYPKKDQYILRPDGTKRPIPQGEFNGHNYEELLKSEQDSK